MTCSSRRGSGVAGIYSTVRESERSSFRPRAERGFSCANSEHSPRFAGECGGSSGFRNPLNGVVMPTKCSLRARGRRDRDGEPETGVCDGWRLRMAASPRARPSS